MPYFSTIIATYNRADLIDQTLRSVLAQEFSDQEVIVVDDGSTDNTDEVLRPFEGKIRVIKQKNAGLAAARNTGLAAATGRYYAILDSDDLWLPWTLKAYHDTIEACDQPALIASASQNFHDVADVSQIHPTPLNFDRFDDYFRTSKLAYSLPTCGVAVRTDVLRSVGGFFDQRLHCEDLDLWMRIGDARGFAMIQSPICSARRLHDANMVSDAPKMFNGIWYLIEKEKSGHFAGGDQRRVERIELLSRFVRPVAVQCLRSGVPSLGWQLYRACFGWNVRLGRAKYLAAFPAMAAGIAGGLVRGRPR